MICGRPNRWGTTSSSLASRTSSQWSHGYSLYIQYGLLAGKGFLARDYISRPAHHTCKHQHKTVHPKGMWVTATFVTYKSRLFRSRCAFFKLSFPFIPLGTDKYKTLKDYKDPRQKKHTSVNYFIHKELPINKDHLLWSVKRIKRNFY